MAKPYHKAIILVLASDNTPLYRGFRDVYKKYIDVNPNVKIFLVYGNKTGFTPQEHDLIFDVEENYYPGMITKTVKALEYIEKNYNYDYMLRTNLSTFWDIDLFLERLDKLPDTECFSGTIRNCTYKGRTSDNYIAGVNLVLSRDLVQVILKHSDEMIAMDLPEDWALSQILKDKGYTLKPSLPGAIHFLVEYLEVDENRLIADIAAAKKAKHDHYRIKNKDKLRQEVDLGLAKLLLKYYYDIKS